MEDSNNNKKEKENSEKDKINNDKNEDIDEIVLFGDEDDTQNNNDKSIGFSDSQSKEEDLTLEEYYLEC